jgi:hypothetical protein
MNLQKVVSGAQLGGLLIALVTSLSACYAAPSATVSSPIAVQTEEIEKLKTAEYQDDISAMKFEDSNQKLGNYYETKAVEAHRLIDQMEKGQQVDAAKVAKALNTEDADKYDNRPPVPLDDELGNGY